MGFEVDAASGEGSAALAYCRTGEVRSCSIGAVNVLAEELPRVLISSYATAGFMELTAPGADLEARLKQKDLCVSRCGVPASNHVVGSRPDKRAATARDPGTARGLHLVDLINVQVVA